MSSSTQPEFSLQFAGRAIFKALALFLLVILAFGVFYPMSALGRVTGYNFLFPGRRRLPYGDNPSQSYNLSLYNLEAMFASHELAKGEKPADEYRVLVIGDSSTWGFLLGPDETLAANITQAGARLPDGRRVVAYNLGYPVMSLTKDLLILSRALAYQPDLIVWPFTLESFPYDKQLFPPLLQNNPGEVRELIESHDLNLDPQDPALRELGVWARMAFGARRQLADLIRLQLYGFMWAATGIDQEVPEDFTPRQEDLEADPSFHDIQPPRLERSDLALDVLAAGVSLAGSTPVLLVNEPMYVSQGENSDIRYNFYYPRWAYDDYRKMMAEQSAANGWRYLDLWDILPNSEFTNTAVHLTPAGTQLFAEAVLDAILEMAEGR